MKLFENGVGRPSNEIKRKRKIFIAGAIALCIVLVSVLAFSLTKVSTDRLQGNNKYRKEAAQKNKTTTTKPVYTKDNTGLKNLKVTSIWCNPSGKKCNDRSINLYFSSKGTYVRQMSYVICLNKEDCTANNAWDRAIAQNRHSTSNVKTGGYTMYMDEKNKTIEGRTFYARITTYTSSSSSDWANVYVIKFKPTNYDKKGKDAWKTSSEIVWSKYNTKKITTTTTKTQPKKINLTCSKTAVYVGEEFTCQAALNGAEVTVGGAKSLASGYAGSFTAGQNKDRQTTKIKYAEKLFTDYKSQIKTDSKGKRYINAKITATKSGYSSAYILVRIYEKVKTIKLDCPDSAETNKAFKCTTDQADVKITVGGAKALASGYSSSFTTKSSDKTKDIKYSDKLFNGTWAINTDSNGKEYVTAQITAEKSGYTKTTKKVKIYKGTTSSGGGNSDGNTPSTTEKLTLTCPASAKVNEAFKCTTNLTGVKLTVGGAKALASGYKATFTTTKDDKVKGAKYTNTLFNGTWTINKDSDGKEYVTAQITAEKSGYTKITKKVKIYSGKVSSNGGTTTKKTTGKTTSKITTTKKPTTTASSTFAPYNINYSITKVTKKGDNGEKSLEFKISKVGSDVKYVNHAICFERDACITGDETRYKAMTAVVEANKGTTYSLDITTENPGLLNQDFYVRVMTYDKDKNFIYYKTHHFHTNPKTSSNSTNSSISDESKVQIGDFTGTTHDFLFSLKCKNVNEKYKANYAIPSVKKASEIDIDSGVKKIVNIAMHDFGEDVKYVSFAVCIKEKSCKKNNTILYVSEDSERGAVLQYQVPERGKEYPIELIAENDKMLKQKFYVRIYTYDANKMLLYSKIHEFTTGEKTKLGVKKESEIKVGDRVISESTDYLGSKKYIN